MTAHLLVAEGQPMASADKAKKTPRKPKKPKQLGKAAREADERADELDTDVRELLYAARQSRRKKGK